MKSKVVSGLSWSMAEKLLTEFVNLCITIVLSRLLLPEHYGTVALIQVFISISTIFVTCGLGNSLVQKKDPDDTEYATMFYINVLIGLFLYLVIFAASPLIANFYENGDLIPLIKVLALKIPIASIYNIQQAYVQKRMEFKKFFFSSLSGTLISGIVGILMAMNGFGVWSLITATLVDQTLDSLILFITTRWLPTGKISLIKTKPMFKFAYKIILSEFVSRAYEQIRSLAIGKAFSPSDLAYNSKGQKFPQMIIEVTNTTIIRVISPTFSEYQDDKIKMVAAARRSVSVSSFLLAPLLIGMAATANHLVPLIFTDTWNACIPFLQLYCFTYLFQPIHSINLKIIQSVGRSDIALKIELFKKGMGLIFLAIAVFVFKNALIAAASFTAMSLVALFVNAYPCKILIGYGLVDTFKDSMPSIILAVVMGSIVYLLGIFIISDWLALFIQVTSGAIIYMCLCFVFKLEPMRYLLGYLVERSKNGR
ncbi:MAG: lipopolysaccharide biosynthesis protein [Erysipelotrichaceae bacterium]|nr:lipopolysaccharide biosynthesis protein [Erysipelotrichaceae bacterium]